MVHFPVMFDYRYEDAMIRSCVRVVGYLGAYMIRMIEWSGKPIMPTIGRYNGIDQKSDRRGPRIWGYFKMPCGKHEDKSLGLGSAKCSH